VPFNVPCVVERLAAHNGIDPTVIAGDLERRAKSLGGEVIEDEVRWLPANQFDTV
jgi:hypothetical protein